MATSPSWVAGYRPRPPRLDPMLRLLPPRLDEEPILLRLLPLEGALKLRELEPDERVEKDGELLRGDETLGALRWIEREGAE